MSGIPAWAVKGAKVVCIKTTGKQGHGTECKPVEGGIYTIRAAVLWAGRCPAIWLVEIVNPPELYEGSEGPVEPMFALAAFRPLVTRTQEQDLQIFTPLLHRTKERA